MNGDTVVDTTNDQWGFLTHSENAAALWIAAGERAVGKNSNDLPEIQFNTARFDSVWNKICDLMNNDFTTNNDIALISTAFKAGRALFINEILKFARDYREMTTDFGILPTPKYEESQDSYHTYVAESAPVLCIPISNGNLERTSVILEAMAADGHRQILPIYYDVNLKSKLTRDEESVAMLNICYDTRSYEPSIIFNWGDIKTQLKNYSVADNRGLASLYDSKLEAINVAIEKTLTAYGLN